jgi:hypothetical protein
MVAGVGFPIARSNKNAVAAETGGHNSPVKAATQMTNEHKATDRHTPA